MINIKGGARLVTLCFIVVSLAARAQDGIQTLTISTGAKWNDVLLMISNHPPESYFATKNFNVYPRIAATAWTHSGQLIKYRTLLKFDLADIPAGASIQNATLFLYSDPVNTSGEISNQPLSGSNALYIERVTQSWDPTTVTWSNQPATTPTGRILLGASSSTVENIQIDISTLVREMITNQVTNYGLLLSEQSEVQFRSRNYASTDHANATLHPKLVIQYTATFWAVRDGDWSEAIWSTDKNSTVGVVLPPGSIAAIFGHTVKLRSTVGVKTLSLGAANGLPGVLTVDGGELKSLDQVSIANDHVGNKLKLENSGKLSVNSN
jgi:hypothetical protein